MRYPLRTIAAVALCVLPAYAGPADRYDLDILLGGRSSAVDGIAGVQHSILLEFSRELGSIDVGARVALADVDKIRRDAPNNMGRSLHREIFVRGYFGRGWGAEAAVSRTDVETERYDKAVSRMSLSVFYLMPASKIEASYTPPDDSDNRSSFVSLSYSAVVYRGLYVRLVFGHAWHTRGSGLAYSLALGFRVL